MFHSWLCPPAEIPEHSNCLFSRVGESYPGAGQRRRSLASLPLLAQVSWLGHRQEETFHRLMSRPPDP